MIQKLFLVVQLIVDLILMRKGPQDVPLIPGLLGMLIAMFFLLELVSATTTAVLSLQIAVSLVAVDILFIIIFIKLLLLVFGFVERYQQTLVAIIATQTGFLVLFLPLQYILFPLVGAQGIGPQSAEMQQNATSGIVMAVTMFYLAIFIWFLRVQASIYANALEVRMVFAVAIVILQLLGNLLATAIVMSAIGPSSM